MNDRQIEKLITHFDKYFQSPYAGKLGNTAIKDIPTDVYVYAPTEKYPFWKLATIGASDAVLSDGSRHEYVMYIDMKEPLMTTIDHINHSVMAWYYNVLMHASRTGLNNGQPIVCNSVIESNIPDSEMAGYMYLLPMAVADPGIYKCDLNENKHLTVLEVMPITEKELNIAKEKGIKALRDVFQPDWGMLHNFAEKKRSF